MALLMLRDGITVLQNDDVVDVMVISTPCLSLIKYIWGIRNTTALSNSTAVDITDARTRFSESMA